MGYLSVIVQFLDQEKLTLREAMMHCPRLTRHAIYYLASHGYLRRNTKLCSITGNEEVCYQITATGLELSGTFDKKNVDQYDGLDTILEAAAAICPNQYARAKILMARWKIKNIERRKE